MRGGVVAKVGAHVADPEPLARLETSGELEWWLVQDADLLEAELRVAVGDGLPELVGERVEHRVVRVHRRQTVLLQLVRHDAHQSLAPVRVVRPVADDLRRKTDNRLLHEVFVKCNDNRLIG